MEYKCEYVRKPGAKVFTAIVLILTAITIFLVAYATKKTIAYVHMLDENYETDSTQMGEGSGYDETTDFTEGTGWDASVNENRSKVRISVDMANIRTGPGQENNVICEAAKGKEFITTGNVIPASNGTPWYEIYIDEEMTQTGWASAKVIELIG